METRRDIKPINNIFNDAKSRTAFLTLMKRYIAEDSERKDCFFLQALNSKTRLSNPRLLDATYLKGSLEQKTPELVDKREYYKYSSYTEFAKGMGDAVSDPNTWVFTGENLKKVQGVLKDLPVYKDLNKEIDGFLEWASKQKEWKKEGGAPIISGEDLKSTVGSEVAFLLASNFQAYGMGEDKNTKVASTPQGEFIKQVGNNVYANDIWNAVKNQLLNEEGKDVQNILNDKAIEACLTKPMQGMTLKEIKDTVERDLSDWESKYMGNNKVSFHLMNNKDQTVLLNMAANVFKGYLKDLKSAHGDRAKHAVAIVIDNKMDEILKKANTYKISDAKKQLVVAANAGAELDVAKAAEAAIKKEQAERLARKAVRTTKVKPVTSFANSSAAFRELHHKRIDAPKETPKNVKETGWTPGRKKSF